MSATRPRPTVMLWTDTKFRWLVASVVIVGAFEFLSLAGWHLPPAIDGPFFAAVIVGIGHRTLWTGLNALVRLDFRSIDLLLLIAAVGAFYLGEYEEAAVVVVLFNLAERLEELGILLWAPAGRADRPPVGRHRLAAKDNLRPALARPFRQGPDEDGRVEAGHRDASHRGASAPRPPRRQRSKKALGSSAIEMAGRSISRIFVSACGGQRSGAPSSGPACSTRRGTPSRHSCWS